MKLIHNPLRYSNIEVKSYKSVKVINNGQLVVTTPNDNVVNDFLFDLLAKNSARFPKLASVPVAIITKSVRFLSDSWDIFKYLRPSVLNALKNNKAILIFDMRSEGHSPTDPSFPIFFPILQKLYRSCKKHDVNTQQVVYLSSNLRDEQNNTQYAKSQGITPIHVCSYLFFEKAMNTTIIPMCQLNSGDDSYYNSVDEQYIHTVKSCSITHTDKIFSSLSRVNRNYRSVATFLLSHSDISDSCLISHNKFNRWNNPADNPTRWRMFNKLFEFSDQQVLNWCTKLPLVVDQSEFDINWVLRPYRHLHDQTVFQIVNETIVDDYQQTTLFYSEKTFRPISCFQPFLIYGQPGCNRYLKELGYQLYDDWFDLSFDDVEDPVERYRQLLNAITPTVKMLEQMSAAERVSWRFKNPDVLKHNFQVMTRSQYSEDKLLNLFQNLENTLN
jgi:hypothetical protein